MKLFQQRFHGGRIRFGLPVLLVFFTALLYPAISQTDNDQCDSALLFNINNQDEISLQGTTRGATSDFSVPIKTACDTFRGHKGVWYSFQGNGRGILLDCRPLSQGFSFYVDVFAGNCSSGLSCVTSQFCLGRGQDDFQFLSSSDETYVLWVHNRANGGDFTITLETFLVLANDGCNDAIGPLSPGSRTTGDTQLATADDVPYCVDTDIYSTPQGAWYVVDGTDGMALEVSTNATVSIYSGSCRDLVCIGGNEVGHVAWRTASQRYFVLVHSFIPQHFELAVDEFEPINNDLCPDAVGPLPSDGSVTAGSIFRATIDSRVPYCAKDIFTIQGKSVWYTTVGTGETMMASTCTKRTLFYAEIRVLSGECGNFTCQEGNWSSSISGSKCEDETLDGETFLWESEKGQIYYIHVQALQSQNSASSEELMDFGVFVIANTTTQNTPPPPSTSSTGVRFAYFQPVFLFGYYLAWTVWDR